MPTSHGFVCYDCQRVTSGDCGAHEPRTIFTATQRIPATADYDRELREISEAVAAKIMEVLGSAFYPATASEAARHLLPILRPLLEGKRNAEEERDELRGGLLIPGEQTCVVCGFDLHKRLLRASDGAVGVDTQAPLENCPNGCGPLVGVTWERGFRLMADAAEQQLMRARKWEARIEALEKALKGHRWDLHEGSGRPCATCRESAAVLGLKVPDRCALQEVDRIALEGTA